MDVIHGGDIAGFTEKYGIAPLDFSASLNPFGMPPAVAAAARRAVGRSEHYPDPRGRSLLAALADHLDVDKDWLTLGNGAADTIYRFVAAVRPERTVLPVPSFAEYERALALHGSGIVTYPLRPENKFAVTEELIAAMPGDVDALFLCQPNNPTGRAIAPGILHALAEHCHAKKIWLFIDECFCPFLDDAVQYSLRRLVHLMPRLFILGSFTKLYAMAGIRLGYGMCSDTAIIEKVRGAGQPWPVSTIALAAGEAALGENEYVATSLQAIRLEKKWLRTGLERHGCRIIGDDANYLFFHSAIPALVEQLAVHGILIRGCANFSGLGVGYYRVAVRLRDDNDRLVHAIASIAANAGGVR